MEAEAYVVAVKRDKRAEVPPDWLDTVRGTPGVTIVGDSNPERVQVNATPQAIEDLRRKLGECCHVEKVVRRQKY
jgi:hypothetical protein